MKKIKFSSPKLVKIISNNKDQFFILHESGLSQLILEEFLDELKTRKTFEIWDLREIN